MRPRIRISDFCSSSQKGKKARAKIEKEEAKPKIAVTNTLINYKTYVRVWGIPTEIPASKLDDMEYCGLKQCDEYGIEIKKEDNNK